MKKCISLFILCSLFVISCSNDKQTNFLDLKDVNGVYYLEDRPFSGEVLRYYSGGESKVWIKGEMKNGIPTTYQEPVNIQKLNVRNNLYYLINTNTPFTGYIFSEDSRGQMVLEGCMKDGMPSGTTLSYHSSGYTLTSLTINENGFLFDGTEYMMGNSSFFLVKDDSLFFRYGTGVGSKVRTRSDFVSMKGVWLLSESFLNQNLVQQLELISTDYKDIVNGVVNEFVFTSTGEWDIVYEDESRETLSFNDMGYKQIDYYSNGQVRIKQNFVDYEESGYKLEGEAIKYYQNGQIQNQGAYKEGQKDGLYQEYFDDGTLKLEFQYTDGVKNGPFTINFSDGSVKEKGQYLNDNYQSEYASYFDNGQIKLKANYLDGRKTNYEEFNESGGLIEKGTDSRNYTEYSSHKKLGEYSLQYKNGKPFSGKKVLELGSKDKEAFHITSYINGQESVKEFKKFNYDIMVEQGFLENGEKEGTWNEYFYDGNLSAVVTYSYGELNGPYKEFFADGTMQSEGAYINGEIDINNWTEFNEYGEQLELKKPKPLYPIKPIYSFFIRNENIEGTVILRCLISKFGRVTEIEVVKGIPQLNSSARDSVRRVKFRPASIGDNKVPSWIEIPIEFKLK